MKARALVCCSALMLLLRAEGARTPPDLQSLEQLLEEEIHPAPYSSSEEEEEKKDGLTDKSWFGAPEDHDQDQDQAQDQDPSDPSNSVLEAKENLLARLFKDLQRTSKRSWSRNKKGGLRSCFGVRLERIGSFSGLGC